MESDKMQILSRLYSLSETSITPNEQAEILKQIDNLADNSVRLMAAKEMDDNNFIAWTKSFLPPGC